MLKQHTSYNLTSLFTNQSLSSPPDDSRLASGSIAGSASAENRDGIAPTREFLDAPDVAILVGVCERTVRTAAKSGALPSFRIRGRVKFLRSAILDWAAQQSKGGRS